MGNKYNHQESEKKWQKYWEESGIYVFSKDTDKPIYSIDTPPPTVSGKIHIGHIFSYTQAEIIARYKRMCGYNVFYPMGYDNNGIPTEQLVEKELGINIKDVERKDFIQKCLEVVEKYKVVYENLRKSMGTSIDWNRTYTTISPEVQQIAQKTFITLYKEGEIVCKEFPALRCTKMQTTVAQAETEEQEFNEFFNYLNFTLEDGEKLVIATTRPELLPACLAVFVHPDDTRFQKYIGKNITTPLGINVPLLADDKVKMDKGTGVVMCCSYGDEVDVYWIQKHKLGEKIVIDRYGKMIHTGVAEIEGMKIEEAREKIMEYFQNKGDIVVKRDPIIQAKQISERGKVAVEILPVKQWFVNLLDKKEILTKQNEKMNRYPEFMKKRSEDWIQNLQRDRNISRLRKFGIPIPVRYNKATEEILLPNEEQLAKGVVDPTVDLPEGYTTDQVIPETLVLDTRFTSGLTPLINQTYLQRDGYTQNIFPMDLRPQAHDIIRTWLLYTTLQTYFRSKEIPFKNIMISGFCLAAKGEKFSKSKGNNKFDPEQLITQWSADAVRYWATGTQLGKDIFFEEGDLKNGQKLVTKLRNAFQFMKMQLQDTTPQQLEEIKPELYPTDQRIMRKLQDIINEMRKDLDKYEYGLAKIKFEEFFWKDFCDNYLEIIKLRTYKPELFENGGEKKISAQWTLYNVFYAILQLISPYTPHITEEIYQDYFKETKGKESIHITTYPTKEDTAQIGGETIKEDGEKLLEIVEIVRKFKSEQQISMGADLENLVITGPTAYLDILKKFEDDIVGVTKTKKITRSESEALSCTPQMI